MTNEEIKAEIKKNCETLTGMCEALVKNTEEFLQAVTFVRDKNGYDEKFYHQVTCIVFLKYSIRDIFLLYKLLYATEDDAEKNVLARTLATHIAGLIKDMDGIQGKQMTELIKPILDEDLTQMLSTIRNLHKLIKRKYDEMNTIRNFVSAHKDRDIRKQLEIMKSIDYLELMPVIAQIQVFTLSLLLFEKAINQKRHAKTESKVKQPE